MNVEMKQKWVAALRSGNYKQGEGRLRDSRNCYCCLGVLCDISKRGIWQSTELGDKYRFVDKINGQSSLYDIAASIADDLGISGTEQCELIRMNDGKFVQKKTFAEIADWIEANL
jgi:hypothetical protein